jgi:hypothetical protein
MYDLNTLVPKSDNLDLPFGSNINDRGEITGATVNAQGVESAIVLIPRGSGPSYVVRDSVSAPKAALPESLRMRPRDPRARYWDLRTRFRIPR